ncbi:hypothetical protein OX000_33360 [Pseudomonas aeruginosa]|uniref:hypothetical protein n=1 Tax=Pseudomonas aeruginosa TaxID=287 RepID=UPI00227A76B2|nr:hypothetical protein [Pseudomonas aeruginosa]MCY4802465.1 hypothetical protein [Pseudomonas aeruginosa]
MTAVNLTRATAVPEPDIVSQAFDLKGVIDLTLFLIAKLSLLLAYDMSYNYEIT